MQDSANDALICRQFQSACASAMHLRRSHTASVSKVDFFNGTITVVANTAPAVSVHATPANATAPATIDLSATASDTDGTIAKVEFFNGATLLATSITAPYTYRWTNVAVGSYTVTAKATDNLGAATTSEPFTVTGSNGVAQVYYIDTDHLNTPRSISNSNNQIVWRWDNTDPFGNNMPNENPSGLGIFKNNLRHQGQYADVETGLFYNYAGL